MKWLSIILISTVFVLASSQRIKKPMNNLNIVSYNGNSETSDDTSAWKLIVHNFITDKTPDIMGLQGCESSQVDYVTEMHPIYKSIGVANQGQANGVMNPILYNTERLYPLRSDTFWLSSTPSQTASKSYGNRLPRICTWIEFIDKVTFEKFTVYNTHYESNARIARIRSTKQILAFIGDTKNAILMGDLGTDDVESTEIASIIDQGFTNAYALINTDSRKRAQAKIMTTKDKSDSTTSVQTEFVFTRGFKIAECDFVSTSTDSQPLYARVGFLKSTKVQDSELFTLYSPLFDEYTYAAQFKLDDKRRYVFSWITKGVDGQGIWLVTKTDVDDVFFIRNEFTEEYLFADAGSEESERTSKGTDKKKTFGKTLIDSNRKVYVSSGDDRNDNDAFKWKLVKASPKDDSYFVVNMAFNEYLFTNEDRYSSDRRYVFTGQLDNKDKEKYLWKFKSF